MSIVKKIDREYAEKILREQAKVLVVGRVEDLVNTPLPIPDNPQQKYLLAVLEVE